MSHSLDRLLHLVKRTGDTLVVHNSDEDQDIVILNIDRYEDLLSEEPAWAEDDSDWHRVGDVLQAREKTVPPSFEGPVPEVSPPVFEEDFSPKFSAPSTLVEPMHHLEDISSALITPIELPVGSQTESPEEELRYEFPVEEQALSESHSLESIPQPPQPITPAQPVQHAQPVPQKPIPTDIDFSEEEPLQRSGPVFFEEPV